jgi:hypothetical protein
MLALPKTQAVATNEQPKRPEPVDYGLTYDDLHLYDNFPSWYCQTKDGKTVECYGTSSGEEFKDGRRWFGIFLGRSYYSQ